MLRVPSLPPPHTHEHITTIPHDACTLYSHQRAGGKFLTNSTQRLQQLNPSIPTTPPTLTSSAQSLRLNTAQVMAQWWFSMTDWSL